MSALNAVAWAVSAQRLKYQASELSAEAWTLMKWQMVLSASCVLGCGHRSVFPVFDVQRQVLIDSWLSSVIVGRSVATVAELCFAAQWALLLRSVAQSCHSPVALRVSHWIVPMIAVGNRHFGGGSYVLYMLHVDVPTYWDRWLHDEGQGRQYLDIAQGLADVSSRWVVSHRWEDWKSEVVWMSLYFSVAVWLSNSLMLASAEVSKRQALTASGSAQG